jgi:hypothetical protein
MSEASSPNTDYSTFCDDFYVNTRLGSQISLPHARDTVLHFLEQIQKAFPGMTRFRKSDGGELNLEEERGNSYRWVNVESRRLSAGHVNPPSVEEALRLHTTVLDTCLHAMGVSPIEIDYLDVLFGFDLEFAGNHDEVVAESLFAESPLTSLLEIPGARPVDVQPTVTVALSDDCRLQARIDVVTRTNSYQVRTGEFSNDVISVYCILRRYWGDRPRKPLPELVREMAARVDRLCVEHVLGRIVKPISTAIASRS